MTSEPGGPPHLGGFRYVQPLGAGGYAEVYLYEQERPRRHVVVKTLRDPQSPSAGDQLAREAHALARLAGHPHVVRLLRVETSTDGRPCLVIDYCPPPNLALRARRQPFPVRHVLRAGVVLAGAVECAHRAGIVHRDIKPSNVLVTQSGVLALTDWGTARCGPEVDHAGEDIGVSLPWAAPELLSGESDGDAASDVYSLAATLWQLLTGHSPFAVPGGDNSAYALVGRIRSRPAPGTSRFDVPPALERLLARALDRDPAARPASVAELGRGLQAVERSRRLPRTPLVVVPQEGGVHLARRRRTSIQPTSGGAQRTPGPPLPGGTCIAAAAPSPLVDTSLRRRIATPSTAMALVEPAR